MRIKPCLLVVILVALAIAPVFADGMFVQSPLYPGDVSYTYSSQLGISGSSTSIPVNAVLQAIGNTDYPVTPGDSFTLAYSDGKNLVTLELQADSDCRVMIQSVGVVEAAGLTYREFKLQVEDLISKYYTYSAPQLVLKNCGVFSVRVSGEVNFTQYVTAWGLSRLSDLADYATRFASTRSVTLITKDGTSRDYDLYAALRDDSFENNPLLSPGCEVRFNKASSIISLGGAVRSPGVYQPLAGQTLYQVIESYGDGLLNSADERVISVSNFQNGQYSARQLSMEQAKSYVPADGDSINITSGSQVMPYVTITGALVSESATNLTAASRINYNFIPGETALQLVRNIAPRLLATSDTSAIYILRLVTDWMLENGGLAAMEQTDIAKAKLLYDYIDNSGFYRGTAAKASRSRMNVTFRLPTEDQEKAFVAYAKEQGLLGLKGHRAVGGCRASIYNAVPLEGVQRLVEVMEAFRKQA